ncbi:MAG: right-handed parallel beta-helix repeat-containing protein [Ruminococcus sp.]|nr:right-handed parallel beta-helix repeat-containing protein [Ruminococcus sp.]
MTTKKIINTFAAIIVVLLVCVIFSPKASAATGSSATGAQLPDYDKIIEVNAVDDYEADPTGTEDSWQSLQRALNVGKSKASDTTQVVVNVPAGTYNISKTLRIYSNTRLVLDDDATIIKCFNSGCMLKNTMHDSDAGKYSGNRNIVIEGGTWDGNTSQYSGVYSFSNIRIGHAKNILFSNVSVINNKNGHHLEIGGVKGLTVEGCYFSGYTGSLLKEAIQLDVMNCADLFSGYSPFDDTACANVIIKNNTFEDLVRAIGSHSAVAGVYYSNITITGNKFKNVTDVCMFLYNYRKCTISSNTISGCGAGITFNYMTDDDSLKHYFEPVGGVSSAKANIQSNANTIIENNKIRTKTTTLSFTPYAIKLYGENVTEATDEYPAADYSISNVRISSNTIKSAYSAIIMRNVHSSSVKDNTITSNDENGSVSAHLIDLSGCSDISFTDNTIKNSLKSGISISSGSDFTISGCTFNNNEMVGVTLSGVSNTVIKESSFSSNSTGAISIRNSSDSITCASNVIGQKGGYGIQVSESTATLESNDITGADKGIKCVDGSKITVGGNSFEAVSGKIYYEQSDDVTIEAAQNLSAEEVTSDLVKITWTAINEADGINVYRKVAGEEEFELLATLENGSIFQDERLAAGTNYVYKIVPFMNFDGESIENTPSEEIGARTKISIDTAYIECVSEAGFTAKPITPTFTIVANSRELEAGIDYDYSYSNNLYVGTATITVTGKGDYTGTLTYNFEITLGASKVNDSASRTSGSGIFLQTNNRKYYVVCTRTDERVLATSDELLSTVEQSLNAYLLQVPIEYKVTTAIWSNGEYQFF